MKGKYIMEKLTMEELRIKLETAVNNKNLESNTIPHGSIKVSINNITSQEDIFSIVGNNKILILAYVYANKENMYDGIQSELDTVVIATYGCDKDLKYVEKKFDTADDKNKYYLFAPEFEIQDEGVITTIANRILLDYKLNK
jgi:hypothetical protein